MTRMRFWPRPWWQRMSLADLSRKIGVPPQWRQEIWPLFELAALELVGEACGELARDRRRTEHWREAHFSWALYEHLERLCRTRNLAFSPREEQRLLSDEDLQYGTDPRSAPRIDFLLRWHNLDPKVFFGLEAKILVATGVGSYTPAGTIRGYVDEGMRRFVESRYAESLPVGAMLGYVLSGAVAQITGRINARIEELPLPCHEPLVPKPMTTCPADHYESVHPRSKGGEIRLHHLFTLFE